jgi:dihydroxy-acid dehydratase
MKKRRWLKRALHTSVARHRDRFPRSKEQPPQCCLPLDAGLLHGDCMTVTGRTMRENLEKFAKPYPEGQEIVRPVNNPLKKDSHLRILYGNLAEGGAVAKISGKEGELFQGKARVYNSEDCAMKAILAKYL